MKQVSMSVWAFLGVIITTVFTACMLRIPTARMPQRAQGDLLSVFASDARATLSLAMVHKADSYFHGGAEIDWQDCHYDHDHDDHADHDEPDKDDHTAAVHVGFWQSLYARIHVQNHRHLAGKEMVEIIPWFWAAIRANPHNSEAYTSAAFVLSSTLHDPTNAVAVLDEGIAKNPNAAELFFDKGRLLLRPGTGLTDTNAAQRCFLQAAILLKPRVAGGGDTEDVRLYLAILSRVARAAYERGDVAAVRAYAAEAYMLFPTHPTAKSIEALLVSPPKKD